MLHDEIIMNIMGKTALECPEVNQKALRAILQDVLYDSRCNHEAQHLP